MATIKFKSARYVWAGAALLSVFAIGAMMLHVQINYNPDMRDLVRSKAALATLVVSFPLALFFFYQMHKNYLLNEELQRLVNRDRLTDVATRDYFFTQLQANPMAYGVSLMIDIDHFKSVNDTYGHFAGDLVIQQVAAVLKDTIKDVDIVCRFGGEEFVVFLHDHDAKDGFYMAERLREKVGQTKITYEGEPINVTVSIGGSMKDRIDTINTAIKDADEALYRAKQGGRNQTVFAPIRSIQKVSV